MNSSKARTKKKKDGPEITCCARKKVINKQENDKSMSKRYGSQTEKVPDCQNILNKKILN